MEDLFDNNQKSDLSRAVMDKEDRDSGEVIMQSETDIKITMVLAIILVVALISSIGYFLRNFQVQVLEVQSEYGSGVVERDGALYYPDGTPVRNYEQLNLYLEQ